MDRNLLLACALSFLVVSLWAMLQAPPPRPVTTPESPIGDSSTAESGADPMGVPPDRERQESTGSERYPALSSRSAPDSGALAARSGAASAEAPPAGETFEIERPLYAAELSSVGATLRSWQLRTYHDPHGDPILLVDPRDAEPSAATPFVELGPEDLSRAVWQLEERSDGQLRFVWRGGGVALHKTYRFPDDGYDFRLLIEVANESDRPLAPAFLVEWPIQERSGNDFREQSAAALIDGSVEMTPLAGIGSPGFFGRFSGKERGQAEQFDGEIDWTGVQTPYFLAALFPDQPVAANARFVPLETGKRGVVQVYFDPVTLAPGQSAAREYRAYVGPKELARLHAFAPSATESVDLGWSIIAPMTRAFGWLLAVLYSFVPNYGVAIILLTVLVRAVTAPLTVKQMRSMERMRRIQPKVKAIQEKYADNRQKQSEAMMSLYRQEKVNPLGGCLPMLLQLPVFIGLFYALRSSIQLRQAPFFGWIDDLSAPDLLFTIPGVDFPVRVLPLLMGASMFVQQKITPMQMDPAQARMMLTLMPLMMTFISYQFPSGLVLYWMLSNVLAIGHQLWIGRRMAPVQA